MFLDQIAESERRLARASADSEHWLRESALPLWATNGFDAGRDMFEERLDLAGKPVPSAPRRLMVQARQISVYAAAALSGRYPAGGELAFRAARKMVATYLEADRAPGWVFSVQPDGKVIDAKRDLYAHAFVVFALAWVMRLEADQFFAAAVDKTLDFIDCAFADPVHGGYWDCLPRADALRRQNPHMHLFEACIVLYDITRRGDILRRCRELCGLALSRFFDPATGALREYFDDRWAVHPKPGQGIVEPGHLYEWAWLLRQYEKASGVRQDAPVTALIALANRCGLSSTNGRIVDEVGEDGAIRSYASRCWPHAEALKALTEEALRGDRLQLENIAGIADRLQKVYCPDELAGGWIDHVDPQDKTISGPMPASSFYHIYFGFDAIAKIAKGVAGQTRLNLVD